VATLLGDIGVGYTAQFIDNVAIHWQQFTCSVSGTAKTIIVGHNKAGDTARTALYDSTGNTFLGGSVEIASTLSGLNNFDISAANILLVAGTDYRVAIFVNPAGSSAYFRPFQSSVAGPVAPATTILLNNSNAATYPTWPAAINNGGSNMSNKNVQWYVDGTFGSSPIISTNRSTITLDTQVFY
jgi:hypothetical protein